jgi:diaminopimelate decarboxylase
VIHSEQKNKLINEQVIQYIREVKQTSHEPFCAYIYDLKHVREHVQKRVHSLPSPCQLYYAIKANSERKILEALAPIVKGFEVASIGEVKKVREIDSEVPIIFGGPGKTNQEIEEAIQHRVRLLHVESAQELVRVAYLAEKLGKQVSILLRVNLRGPLPNATLAMGGRPTQFGIDESEISEVIQLSKKLPSVRLEGFHLHSISNNLDSHQHVQLIEYYCELVTYWAQEHEIEMKYLNVGGGIGVNYANLEEQFEWDSFVSSLASMLERKAPQGVEIIFECGRYLTASCGYYATEVLDMKQNHGEQFVIVRGGTQHFRLPVSWQHSHPFQILPIENWEYPFPRKEIKDCQITVVGQLCTPKDVLAKKVEVPKCRIGDVIIFQYAGAYGWAISHHDFLSHPHPKQVYLE